MAWRKVARFDALRDGGVTGVEVEGVPVALFRMGEAVHATHGICTHALAFLKDGYVEDGTIECPLHQGVFDIRTGRALCAPLTKDLATYAARVEAGEVFVDLELSSVQRNLAPDVSEGTEEVAAVALPPLVIVGAGQAAAAAIRAARAAGLAAPIHLVGDEAHLPYERPPLSKDALAGTFGLASATRLPAEDAATLDVALHLGVRAEAVDPDARTVTLSGGTVLAYGALLLATGGSARRLAVPGADLPGVHHLRTIEDAQAIAASLATAGRVAVVGGGFIGLELASAARARGAEVVVLEREDELMARLLPPALGAVFRRVAEKAGVTVRRGVGVEAIAQDGRGLALATTLGPVEADVVLVGVGLVPETALAEAAGCAVDGGIVVDAAGRTSVPDIFAAGDCALHHAPIRGHRRRLESWQNAEEQGAAAGRAIAGEVVSPSAKAPWFWTDQFGLNIQMVGTPGAADAVVVSGADGTVGAVYRTLDPETGRVTAVIAFDDPAAIRAGRAELAAETPFDPAAHGARPVDVAEDTPEEDDMSASPDVQFAKTYVWPEEGLSVIPDWVYTDDAIYQREVERIFHGRTWNFVALECEVENPGDFIRSNVGPTPVVVARAEDGTIHAFENRCAHRAAEFCRDLSGNAREFVCPYHQWSYDLKGNLVGVPFRRGVDGKGGMPKDFKPADHGLRQLNVTTHRGVVFASYVDDMESFPDYLGPEVLREFEATFDGRKLKLLGHYRHSLPGNWKLYHENLKDPYHATLLHTFLVTFGLLVAGNKSLMLADPSGRHGVMASAKSDATVSEDKKKEMRAYKEGMTLEEPRFMNFIDEFDSPWSVTMATIWPNLIVQREMNTLGIRHIVPTGPNEFIMKWTMFGFEGDDEEMTRHRLRQGNLMGPAGFLGLEDNEAIKFVQDGMIGVPGGEHLVQLDPQVEAGTSDTLISEAAIRAMYRHWRDAMGIA
ncbi:FAD-dependent oxidoreductase [Xanthobacter dioxanivorans]|uniref:FAD-dependent oxidoreductase n=1 Tax=Xanthobacter dioxanivorans TaxID=2528964 RepID=A0A974SJ24_9HYPH|nr:FAD-dependent oxidoreductase [Xanthobacter dioxanivorans]QRG05948.1 FAD-dependent oxidoreductase [Xanthobacter dioxanivorans]